LRSKSPRDLVSNNVFTLKAFANFSPALERSDYAGEAVRFDSITPKVLANAFGVINQNVAGDPRV
jgi:hypothetical protein